MRAAALPAALLLAAAGCSDLAGGPPGNVVLSADTDSTVLIAWTAPAQGTPAGYLVYFQETGSPSYTLLADTTATSWVHVPRGMTGTYRVRARFGAEVYEAAETPTTVPVHSETLWLAEVDASGNSGYGWAAATGAASSHPMTSAASAPGVDCYVTDFDTGFAGPAYFVASPHHGPTDPSGVVPTAAWRASGFVDVSPFEQGPLPAYADTVYLDYREVAMTPAVLGCFTEDGHYALLRVNEVDAFHGELELESWYQLVPGLRLVRH